LPEGERVMILAPIVRGRKGEFKKQLQTLAKSGYVRGRVDGVLHNLDEAIKLAKGIVLIAVVDGEERLYSEKMACVDCGLSIPAIEPRTFSFNSIYGACEVCNGLGMKFDFDPARVVTDPTRPILNGGLGAATGWFDEEL